MEEKVPIKIEKYSVSLNQFTGVCKSPALWGHRKDSNGIVPLIYFRKPKWVSDESFREIVKEIRLVMPKDFLVSGA